MKWTFAVIGSSLAGSVVWWLTAGLGPMTAFFLSTIASGFGWYYGVKFANQLIQ